MILQLHKYWRTVDLGFAARDALTGRAVSLSDGTQGTVQGVAADGALQVQTAAGVVSVTSSEISVRPQPPVQGCRTALHTKTRERLG